MTLKVTQGRVAAAVTAWVALAVTAATVDNPLRDLIAALPATLLAVLS